MPSIEDLLDDEEFWDSLRRKLLQNNAVLWESVWESGGKAAYQLGSKRVARELGISWQDIPFRGQEYYISHGRTLCEQLTDTDLSQIRDILEKNWGVGEKAFARQAEASQLASPARLKNIYRTEIHYSNEYAGLHQALDAGVETRSWLAVGDERMCELCAELEAENQEVPIDRPFSNGEMTAHAHNMCILPETLCIAPGGALAGMKSFYRGPIYELSFRSGVTLSVTPNHMILTPHGFAPAYLLRKGDNVLYCPDVERIASSIDYYNHRRISTIKQEFESLMMGSEVVAVKMPATPEYFHGDGRNINGDIDVVWPNRLLSSTMESPGFEHLPTQNFGLGNTKQITLSGECDLTLLFIGAAAIFGGDVSGIRKPAPFFLRRLGHSQKHRFAPSTRDYAGLIKSCVDPITRMPQRISDLFDRHSRLIPRHNQFGRSVRGERHATTGAHFDTPSDMIVNRRDGTTKLIGDLCKRHTGLIELDSLIDVDIRHYHGFVYDLQSISTLLICNNILVSNCRCRAIYNPR